MLRGFPARVRDAALEVLSPTRCIACERSGSLLCDRCLSELELIDPLLCCARCGAPAGALLCTECDANAAEREAERPRGAAAEPVIQADGSSGVASSGPVAGDPSPAAPPVPALSRPLARTLACAAFTGPAPRIIRGYKDAGERRMAGVIAEMLLDTALHAESADPDRYHGILTSADAVTFVPATGEAFRRRGFDHMEEVARALARIADKPFLDALAKHGRSDQRLLGRAGRMSQAGSRYEVVADVAGMRLLLIDDVITTGATIRAAATALVHAGALNVDALALARVW